jgi:erythromycin esterase
MRTLLAAVICAAYPAALEAQDPAEREAVVEWVTEHALPLTTVEAGSGFEDMEPLVELIGDARIVSLGESTHGSREFFQLKHRMLEFLVERMGFTVFGIEASYPDCVAINEYVEHGVGDPAAALHGQGFWTWDTEEVLALIEWMRVYNADPAHENKLRFYGVDMQVSSSALGGALAYVRSQDAELAEALGADLEPLARSTIFADYAKLTDGQRQGLELGMLGLLEFFDLGRETLVANTSADEWERARQHAVVVGQASELMAGTSGNNWRDRCMAENTTWVLEQEPAGTRIVLWAHNGHIKEDGPPEGYAMMGHFLDQAYGDEHLSFGFGFHHGGFQAMAVPREEGDTGPGLRPFEVGPPTAGTVGEVLGEAGPGIFALDLRLHEEAGPVAEWLSTTKRMRSIGAIYSHATAERWYRPTILAEQFDALLFVAETTPARPNPLTRRKHGIDSSK